MTIHTLTDQWVIALHEFGPEDLRDDTILREWPTQYAAAHEGEIPRDVARYLCLVALTRAARECREVIASMESIAPIEEAHPDLSLME